MDFIFDISLSLSSKYSELMDLTTSVFSIFLILHIVSSMSVGIISKPIAVNLYILIFLFFDYYSLKLVQILQAFFKREAKILVAIFSFDLRNSLKCFLFEINHISYNQKDHLSPRISNAQLAGHFDLNVNCVELAKGFKISLLINRCNILKKKIL